MSTTDDTNAARRGSGSNDLLGQAPERATVAALRKCAEWLAYCLRIGWRREQLDALEAIWWQHHDRTGRLV